jgi:hypothetical protein
MQNSCQTQEEGYLEADTSEYYSAYTAENTKIVVLDGNSYEDCFVFTSSIMCNQSGLFSGSCGYNIAVFKKNENAYDIVYEDCGFNVVRTAEAHYDIACFEYDVRSGYKIKTCYNGKKFDNEIITVNGLPYKPIKQIIAALNKDNNTNSSTFKYEENKFFRYDPSNSNDTDNKISISHLQIGNNNTADLYTIIPSYLENYYIIKNDSIIFNISHLFSIEPIKNPDKEFYDLKILDKNNYVLTEEGAIFIPTYYTYNYKSKYYEKIQ